MPYKPIHLTISTILTILSFYSCGQSKEPPFANPEVLNAKYVRLIRDTAVMMLIQNVVIHYGHLYAEADSALLDKPAGELTVYGLKKGSFKGETLDISAWRNHFHYKKGAGKLSE